MICPISGVDKLAKSLGSSLRELYLDDCQSVDVKLTLPALKKLEQLELSAIDLVNLCKLTDSTLAYLANGCQTIQTLKLCRNSFRYLAMTSVDEAKWFNGDNLENKVLYSKRADLPAKHSCITPQLALAWLLHQGNDIVPIPGTTKVANLANNIRSLAVKLTECDLNEISDVVPFEEVGGNREYEVPTMRLENKGKSEAHVVMGACTSSISAIFSIFLIHVSMGASDPTEENILQCLSNHSWSSPPISSVTFFPNDPSYVSVLQSYIRNLRFMSTTTPNPLFIVAPTHVSHIQASIICSKIHGLQVRIRSGGHGLSYVSDVPFITIDMFNLRAISLDVENGSAWVESGATLGEVYYRIAEKSKIHGFPAGVCPTVGVGGHFSGGGYGNLMRKYGLSVDNVIDAKIVDVNGRLLDRESMGDKLEVADEINEDLFIRVVLMPSKQKKQRTVKAKFVALFLGNAEKLRALMDQSFPKLGLKQEDYMEMNWIQSVLFWWNYPNGTSMNVLLERQPKSEKFLKKKSDYVQEPIQKPGLEGLWKKMMELGKPVLTFNPYGGKMSEISELDTPFPHRAGNKYKIQYSVNWKEEGVEASDRDLDLIRKLYDYMTPYVSKSPRCSYLNYRDVDLGTNGIGTGSYSEASIWGTKYFKGNFDKLVQVKSVADPHNFFRYEQSIPPITDGKGKMAE
ncbi:hypothetical protein FNV43_RR06483 [Rhamnella rubrinervis]|uniref:FAD-binding PCMH-type domain-containing protein n=1 Tax=Rhamnella rubrinervis TaxID=2594499 RepID=A0A8K0HD52_9ROSA|nr:hypothetical protein FNV43_RR06483 [Rhamnella rubrinervis]